MKETPAPPERNDRLQRGLIESFEELLSRASLRQILGNVSWLLSENLLRLFVGLFVGVWVARYLGPAQFGVLSYAVALAAMFGNVAGMGLDSIVVRDIVRDPDGRRATLGTAFVLKALSGIGAGVLVIATVSILRTEDVLARTATGIMAAALAFKAIDVIQFWFESQVQSKFAVWARNTAFLIIAGVKLVLIVTRQTLLWFVLATMAEIILGALCLLIVYRLAGGRVLEWRISAARAKGLLKISWPLMLSTAAVMVYLRIDTIMLGSMANDSAVGVYSAAVRISELWWFVPVAIVASVFPSLLQAKDADPSSYESRFAWLLDIMIWLGLGIAVVTTLCARIIVLFLYGESYVEAASVLAIHIWAGVFVFLGVASEKWLVAENLIRLVLFRSLLGAGVNVTLNFLLIPAHGVMGAAMATLIAQAAACYGFDVLLASTRQMFWSKTRSLLLISSLTRARLLIASGLLRSWRGRR